MIKRNQKAKVPLISNEKDDVFGMRLNTVIGVLKEISLELVDRFLDIGLGEGQIAKWLVKEGKNVTGIGLGIESYGMTRKQLEQVYGIKSYECSVEEMPFPDKSFDAVIMSHVLEHCPNISLALQEVRRVLSDDGYLFVFVPPGGDIVCGGHLTIGWNIGQLMYVLLMNGFEVSFGKFIECGYNVAGIVKKTTKKLPPLRMGRGDIDILNQYNFFPVPIVTGDGFNDNYYGKIKAINWDPASSLLAVTDSRKKAIAKRLSKPFMRLISSSVRMRMAGILTGIAKILNEGVKNDVNNVVNPKMLKGHTKLKTS